MGSSKKVTVGYRYFMGIHAVLCRGPVDKIKAIYFADRLAWSGEVTSSQSIQINQPELFGGEKKEGGVQGQVDIMMGEPTQTRNAYLQEKIQSVIPAFRGVVSLVFRSFYFSAMTPYAKKVSIDAERIPQKDWLPLLANINGAANPAHIILDMLTHPEWGMGYTQANCNMVRLAEVAQTLYDEGFGLSFVINSEDDYEKIIEMIMTHVNGLFFTEPDSGLFTIALLRGAYLGDIESLPSYDESNCELEGFERPSYGEMVNEITVKYRPQGTVKDDTVTATNIAAIQNQGVKINQTVNYPAIDSADLAAHVASRDLRQKSTPLAKFRIRVNRVAWNLKIGDVFRFSWSRLGVNQIIGRVLQIDYGTIEEGVIVVEAVEDVFGLPVASYIVNQPAIWTDPAQPPQALVDYKGIEAPYWEVVQNLGEEAAQDFYVGALGAAFLITFAGEPSFVSSEYELWTPTGSSDDEDNEPTVYPQSEVNIIDPLGPTGTFVEVPVPISYFYWLETGDPIYIQDRATGVTETLYLESMNEIQYVSGPVTYTRTQITLEARSGGSFPAACRLVIPAPAGISKPIMGYSGIGGFSGYCMDENDTTLGSFSPAYDSVTNTFTNFVVGVYYIVDTEIVYCSSITPLTFIRGTRGTTATKHVNGAYFFRIYSSSPTLNAYEEVGSSNYCAVAYVPQAVNKTDKTIPDVLVKGNYGRVRIGSYCVWDNEICTVEHVSRSMIIIGRGALDTIPQTHSAGSKVFFCEDSQAGSEYQYAESDVVEFKLRPRSLTNLLDLSAAPTNLLTMVGRMHRPYPPGRVGFNDELYPDYYVGLADLTWAHRDALMQTAQVVDHTFPDVGPQTGTKYEVKIWNEDDVLIRTLPDLTFNHFTVIPAYENTWDPQYETVPRNEIVPYSPDPQAATVNSYCHFEDYGYGDDWTHDEFQPRAIVDGITGGSFTLGWTFWNGATLTTADKKFGTKSLYLDGVSAYARSIVGWQTSALNFGLATDAFTIEFWANLKNLDTTIPVGDPDADKINPLLAFSGSGYWLRVHPLTMQLVVSNLTPATVYATDIVPQNVWVHFALVRRAGGTQLDIYMNGKRQSRYTVTPFNMGLEFFLGVSDLTSVKYTEMYVDEFRWTNNVERYNADFTPSETEHAELADQNYGQTVLYVPFLGRESSKLFPDFTGRHTLVATGGVAINNYRSGVTLGTTAVQYAEFDGTTGRIEVQGNSADFTFNTGDFTIEFDLRRIAGAGDRTILDCREAAGGWAVVKLANDRIRFISQAGTILTGTSAMSTTAFRHVAITRQGNTFRLFVNGVLEATATNTINFNNTPASLWIGALVTAGTPSQFFGGHISALRITKGVARYTAAFPIVNQYRFYPTKAPVPKILGPYQRLRLNGSLRFSVRSILFPGTPEERDCMQTPEHRSYRNGYGYNYGRFYGVP